MNPNFELQVLQSLPKITFDANFMSLDEGSYSNNKKIKLISW